jgi:hypothetical protein
MPSVTGISTNPGPTEPGVLGQNATDGGRGVVGNGGPNGVGVLGQNDTGFAVFGNSRTGIGVNAESQTNDAVHGNSHSQTAAGVSGFNLGTTTPSGPGVLGHSDNGSGVVGDSSTFDGVFGVSHNPKAAGVSGRILDASGKVIPDGMAGFFDGSVTVTGKINCPTGTVTCFDVSISNADCAEEFEVANGEATEPGTLMSFRTDGALCPSSQAYDSRVAGVVSGAGEYKPGIVLDKRQGQGKNRVPIALIGKVFCKVDAEYSPIEVGDLLTASPTAGHAMKATDPLKAFGSVIGKALRSQSAGRGMIPVLVALQ